MRHMSRTSDVCFLDFDYQSSIGQQLYQAWAKAKAAWCYWHPMDSIEDLTAQQRQHRQDRNPATLCHTGNTAMHGDLPSQMGWQHDGHLVGWLAEWTGLGPKALLGPWLRRCKALLKAVLRGTKAGRLRSSKAAVSLRAVDCMRGTAVLRAWEAAWPACTLSASANTEQKNKLATSGQFATWAILTSSDICPNKSRCSWPDQAQVGQHAKRPWPSQGHQDVKPASSSFWRSLTKHIRRIRACTA